MKILNKIKELKNAGNNLLYLVLAYIFIRMFHNKEMILHQQVKIKHIKHIFSDKILQIGIRYRGFSMRSDKTYLNIPGKLYTFGNCAIGRGCRINIEGTMLISDSYINCNTTIIIMHYLSIGNGCAIGWNCQFLDDDFHTISYEGKKEVSNSIIIGNHVWIGSGTRIYKNTKIPDGCVIAADAIVRGIFKDQNCLIAGNPARIIKTNIKWN